MPKYYLLNNYLVYDHSNGDRKSKKKYYKETGNKPPKNFSFLKISKDLEVRVVFYDIDIGHFLIKAPSRREAYGIANAIRGFLGLICGWLPADRSSSAFFLLELNKIPKPSWTKTDLVNELRRTHKLFITVDEEIILAELSGGYIVNRRDFNYLSSFVSAAINAPNLNGAIRHLLESRFLFDGFMTGSYYTSHYSRDRKAIPRWVIQKRQLEDGYRYELAFLAAFKGIERFFSVSRFKKHDIPKLFKRLSYEDVTEKTKYVRFHEIFRGKSREITYGEYLKYLLDIRNAVAAHSNANPPEDLILSEDNLFEVQLFLTELISKAIPKNQKE